MKEKKDERLKQLLETAVLISQLMVNVTILIAAIYTFITWFY